MFALLLRGSATQNRLIFQLCFIMPKIKLYVCTVQCTASMCVLAVLSDISKLDCTGQKVDNLRNRWAYIAEFRLTLKWIALHCAFLQFIARIF